MVAGSPWLCINTTGTPLAPAARETLGVVPQRGDIVDQAGPGRHRGTHDRGLAGIDRDQHARPGQGLHDGDHASDLLVRRDGGSPGSGGLAADVDDVGAFGVQPKPVRHRSARLDELPAVRKAVRGDVHHPHDQGPALG